MRIPGSLCWMLALACLSATSALAQKKAMDPGYAKVLLLTKGQRNHQGSRDQALYLAPILEDTAAWNRWPPRASVSKVGGKFRTTVSLNASPWISSSSGHTDDLMPATDLTPEPQQPAQVLYQEALRAAEGELRQVAELLASQPDGRLLGATEFQLRDLAHKTAARLIQAELEHRQKNNRPTNG